MQSGWGYGKLFIYRPTDCKCHNYIRNKQHGAPNDCNGMLKFEMVLWKINLVVNSHWLIPYSWKEF